jgi:hypothetical protein
MQTLGLELRHRRHHCAAVVERAHMVAVFLEQHAQGEQGVGVVVGDQDSKAYIGQENSSVALAAVAITVRTTSRVVIRIVSVQDFRYMSMIRRGGQPKSR